MRIQQLLKLIAALFVLVLVSGAVTPAHAYNPHDSDLMLYDGEDRTIGVYILNLTPYRMTFDSGLSNNSMNGTPFRLKNLMQTTRNGGQNGPFAPIGVPSIIPAAVPGSDLKPYPMVVGFLDAYDYMNAFSTMWYINDVKAIDNNGRTVSGTVKFSINFNRPKPSGDQQSGLFKLISSAVRECIDLVRLGIEWESPLSWLDAFTGAVELGKEGSSFSQENSEKGEGDKMYVSAYVPATDSYGLPSTQRPPGYDPNNDSNKNNRKDDVWADDSVITNQGPINGVIQSSLVVVTQILRGQKAKSGQSDGTVPLMMVSVMTFSDWTTATTTTALYAKTSYGDVAATSPGAKELRKILDQRGKQGKRELALLVRSLKKSQQETLLNAALALHGKQKATPADREKQEALLTKIAGALNKHAKKI